MRTILQNRQWRSVVFRANDVSSPPVCVAFSASPPDRVRRRPRLERLRTQRHKRMWSRKAPRVHLCSGLQRHAWADPADAACCCNGFTRVHALEHVDAGVYRLAFSWVPDGDSATRGSQPIISTEVAQGDADHSPRPDRVTDGESRDESSKEPNPSVPHIAFFRAASAAPEDSPQYQELLAGLLVLRLLDKVPTRTATGLDVSYQEFLSVRRAVDALPDGRIRRILGALVETVSAFARGNPLTRAPKIIAYAQMLEDAALWEPAADAYETAISVIAEQGKNDDLLPLCYARAGYSLRESGLLERAEESYSIGLGAADQVGDSYWSYRLRISLAMLALHKGDLPTAEMRLDRIVEDAERDGASDALARARHNRGLVAKERKQFDKAATEFYAAVNLYQEPTQKQRALVDVAMALSNLGHLDYARRVYLAARRSTSNAEMYSLAGLNLMRIAVLSGERETFEALRAELANETMSGRLRAHYHVFAGQGFRRFGQASLARASFEAAMVTAEAYRVNKLVIEVEEMLNARPEQRPVAWRDSAARVDLAPLLADIDQEKGVFAGAT
jgi:tetratricopeptide (TPR) repeat protein